MRISLDAWEKYRAEEGDYVPMERWGQDHWSTFAYLATRVWSDVSDDTNRVYGIAGVIDNRRMRCAPRLHREFAHFLFGGELADGSKYPSRLKDCELTGHDDWSCVEDFVAAGLIKAYSARVSDEAFGDSVARVEFTEQGLGIAQELMRFREQGGKWSQFVPSVIPLRNVEMR